MEFNAKDIEIRKRLRKEKRLAEKIYVALIGNPERYKYIAKKIENGELTQEKATDKNILKAATMAEQFMEKYDETDQMD